MSIQQQIGSINAELKRMTSNLNKIDSHIKESQADFNLACAEKNFDELSKYENLLSFYLCDKEKIKHTIRALRNQKRILYTQM